MKQIITRTNGTMAMRLDAQAKQADCKIYNLAAGDPNLPIPVALQDGLTKAAGDGVHQYCGAQGLPELRQLLYSNPAQVLIANGAKQLIYMALFATCNPGDTVLIIGPCWSSYREICKMLQLNIVQYLPYESEYWNNDIFEINNYFYKYKPTIVLFNNPANPTGQVEGKYFIQNLISLCEEHDCWLVSDEIYDKFVYEYDFCSCLDKSDRVIYINGFSKAYAATGWRLGYCIAREDLIQQMTLIQGQISGPPNTIIQQAIVNAYSFNYLEPIDKKILQRRRDYLTSVSSKFYNFRPHGGFYFYLPVENSIEVCADLASHNILVTPGDDYGIKNTIRLSFANISLHDLHDVKPYLRSI